MVFSAEGGPLYTLNFGKNFKNNSLIIFCLEYALHYYKKCCILKVVHKNMYKSCLSSHVPCMKRPSPPPDA
jgi:hypothetical protein